MAVPLQIVVEDDAGRRRVVPFAHDEIAVGRAGGGNGLCLPERNVSRRHARFIRANGAVFVEDLDSKNGTLVNGERVTGRRRIREGDLVQIGDYDLAVEGSEDRAREHDTGPTQELPAVEAPQAPPPLPVPARAEPAPPPLPGAVSPAPAPILPDLAPVASEATVAAGPPPSPAETPPAIAATAAPYAAPVPWGRPGFYVAVGAVSTFVGWAAGSVLRLIRGG